MIYERRGALQQLDLQLLTRFLFTANRGEWTQPELSVASVQELPATIGTMLCQLATG